MADLRASIQALKQANPEITNADIREYLQGNPAVQDLLKQQYTDENGQQANFTLNDVWNQLNLNDQYASPYQVPLGPLGSLDVGREMLLGASNVAKGLGETLGLPGTMRDLLWSKFPDQMKAINSAIPGGAILPADQRTMSSDQILKLLQQHGLVDNPSLTPQGFGESQLAGAAEGVGSAIPFAPLGPGEVLASGAAGGLGAEDFKALGLPPALGGLVGAGAAGFGTGAVKNAISLLASSRGAAESAADQLAALRSGRSDAMNEIRSAAQEKAAKIAETLGESPYYQGAGQQIQQDARDWITGGESGKDAGTLPAQLEEAYAPFKTAMSKSPQAEQLQQAYNESLSPGDFREAIANIAPDDKDLLSAFDTAQAKADDLTNLANTTISRVIKSTEGPEAETILPENLARSLITDPTVKGSTFLNRLRQISPNGVNQLTSSFLNPMEGEPGGIGAWGRLPGNVREALVPDAASRATLDQAYADYNSASNTVGAKISAAQAAAKALSKIAGKSITPISLISGDIVGKDVLGSLIEQFGVPSTKAEMYGALAGVTGPLLLRYGRQLPARRLSIMGGGAAGLGQQTQSQGGW